MTTKTTHTLLAGLSSIIFIVTLALFLPTARHDFVNIDDIVYVRGNAHVTGGLSVGNIGWAMTSMSYAGCWMPLTWFSYMTDVTLFGAGPGALHAVNSVYHACNAVLLFLLLCTVFRNGTARTGWDQDRRTFRGNVPTPTDSSARTFRGNVPTQRPRRWGWLPEPSAEPCSSGDRRTFRGNVSTGEEGMSGRVAGALFACVIGTLFWAVHPLRVEPVAWIASRKDVLSLFWELLALLCWIKVVASSSTPQEKSWTRAAFVCFVLALLAKPTAMSFPLLAGLLEFLLTRRVIMRRLTDCFYVAVAGGLFSAAAQRAGGATSELADISMIGRILNAIAALGTYARDTVWPTHLAVPYPHTWPAIPLLIWPSLAICAALGAALAWAGWREWKVWSRQLGNEQTEDTAGSGGRFGETSLPSGLSGRDGSPSRPLGSELAEEAAGTGGRFGETSLPSGLSGRDGSPSRPLGGELAEEAGSGGRFGETSLPSGLSGRDGSPSRPLGLCLGLDGFSLLLAVGLLWILIAVAPMLGLANFGYHSHADRFTYLPSIGLSLLVTGGLLRVLRRSRGTGLSFGLVLLVACGLLVKQSARQVAFWKDDGTLFMRSLHVTGENVIAQRSLGLYFFRQHHNLEAAIDHFGKSIEMGGEAVPHFFRAMYVMMLAEAGRKEEAERQVRLLNDLPEGLVPGKQISSLVAYGAIALYSGDLELARQHLTRAAEGAPNQADAHYLLGQLALKEGNRGDAEKEWRIALEKDMRFDFLRKYLAD